MKLAVIGQITKLEPIDGADRIKLATVFCGDAGTWNGVVGLDFEAGRNVVVFLQDAVLPADPRWAFMERHKWRVRMARFKGVPSECVIVHPTDPSNDMMFDAPPGADFSEQLGVTKYSKPLPKEMQGVARGNFPSFIPKTDEPNFQTVPKLVAALNEAPWVATMKCDGSSTTVWRGEDGDLHVASRNLELQEFDDNGAGNAYWRCARQYDWSHLPAGCALQFALVGPGIQKNPLGLEKLEGRAFTLYNYNERRPMDQDDLEIAAINIGMPIAKVMYSGAGVLSADALRDMARIKYPTGLPGEGLVFRSLDHSISFKVINLDYKD
jgi:RNA ligase (TIGR02306 family)